MEFRVNRKSAWNDEKPCDEAQKVITRYKERGGDVVPRNIWTISFKTWAELVNFIDSYGERVVIESDRFYLDRSRTIEIYDDWRE